MSHEKKDEQQYMGHLSKLEKDEKPVLTDSMACRFLYQCTEPPERERPGLVRVWLRSVKFLKMHLYMFEVLNID